jgi:hypothetical protein
MDHLYDRSIANETVGQSAAEFKTNKIKEPVMYKNLTINFLFTLIIVINLPDFPNQAYAVEQTPEANPGIRFIHMQIQYSGADHVNELWAQFDDKGEILHLRCSFPITEDGPKEVLWEGGDKCAVWFKAGHAVRIYGEKEKRNLEWFKEHYGIPEFDPRLMLEKLDKDAKEGKLRLEQQPSAGEDGTTTLIVTGKDAKNRRMIYKVDQAAKLVKEVEEQRLEDGKYELRRRIRYLDYNKPIDPEVFTFKTPADVIRIDETTQVLGLPKGDLSDQEIAKKVAREFFEALIAKDYKKAGNLEMGLPEARVKKQFGNIKFLRIVSIGEPSPDEETGSQLVPCKVEVETTKGWFNLSSEKTIERCKTLVRPVSSQPDRWGILNPGYKARY